MALGAGMVALLILAALPTRFFASTLAMIGALVGIMFIGFWVMIMSGIVEGILH